ncbi:MerR family transcriptional regulator [Virgibacillus necropolis]|uniref:Transcriptional regulator, MerR n=1 Tax=Virgibacillus necropolis TaxID=163877 RepID=A0A221MF77_9BACI|nr:MerR family transcriptional regulator [Virgibacillus necropolis]ASN06294.1 transcriptional regulator, MerR [Virgibacillus necropolis]
MDKYWKVGELAELTGLTIRTLRYYDQIKLFSPSDHSESGHRLYNKPDLSKLQQILSLKQLGLSLEDIHAVLNGSASYSLPEVLEIQITRMKEDISKQQILLKELESVWSLCQNKGSLSGEDLTNLLGVMKMNQENYFTKEQLDKMKNEYGKIDAETLKKREQDFNAILEKLRIHMQKGTPTTDSNVQDLARQWSELANAFTANEPNLQKAAEKFHMENPGNDLQYGMDAEIYQYIGRALKVKES